jgi:hypothetical protein
MKAKILNIVLIGTLLASVVGCKEKPKQEEQGWNLLDDIVVVSFKDLYSERFSNENVFFLKGVSLDVYERGRDIEIIEDLKGNFVDKLLVYVSNNGFIYTKGDIIRQNENDTLILLIEKTHKVYYTNLNDLKMSNGYVSGYINGTARNAWGNPEVETMLWEDLQKELQELLNSKKIIKL